DLHNKNELTDLALINAHIQYNHPFIKENIKTNEITGEKDLIFRNLGNNGNDLRVKFATADLAQKFKNKSVDIYDASFYYKCEKVSKNISECLYGGTTLNDEKLKEGKIIGANVWVDGVQKETVLIRINKKDVTLQELDIKMRKILSEKYKIYYKSSPIRKGLIVFDMKTPKSYSFDIYDLKGEHDYEIDKIYEDNKTLKSEDISHIDVNLYEN
ncbi:exotoxin, partial [Staphylococcus pseudintermedius]|nr:exotoxin [Staphylococcus pseudintermedius]EGQ4303785.1 exotoxin [Staphylococcus pseudintermedius]